MSVVYRIKHLPTGMYFCPSREVKIKLADGSPYQQGGFYVKSNLSKTGKTYIRCPSVKNVGSHYYAHLITSVGELSNGLGNYAMLPVVEGEWIIEEVA
jgi:hypothetical protein